MWSSSAANTWETEFPHQLIKAVPYVTMFFKQKVFLHWMFTIKFQIQLHIFPLTFQPFEFLYFFHLHVEKRLKKTESSQYEEFQMYFTHFLGFRQDYFFPKD